MLLPLLVAGVPLAAQAAPAPDVSRAGIAAATAEGCTVDERLVNSCRPWFGTTANRYPEVPDYYSKLDQMLYAEERMGRQVEVAHTYRVAGQNSLREEDVHFATRPDTILFVNYQVTRDWPTADGSDDAVNAQIDEMAASVKALGDHKILMSVHHEPENDVTTTAGCTGITHLGTSGTPADYLAMWRNVRARFDAAGVDNVVWVMNYMNYEPFNCMVEELYPGDDLVDWIVWNAYQHGDDDVSFEERARNLYDFFTARSTPERDYLSKVWGLAEWGINESTQESAYRYYAQAKEAVETGRFPKFALYANFDNGDPNTGDGSYRVAYDTADVHDPLEQAAFNAFAHSWRFTGDGTPPVVEPPVDTPPSTPTGLTATPAADGRSIALGWAASVDDVGVAGYEVLHNGVVVGSTATTTWTHTGRQPGSTATYAVRAVDTAGATSEPTAGVTVTTPRPDTTAPSQVTGLSGRLVAGVPQLTWRAATDDVGVAAYDVLRGGVVVGTTSSRSFTDSSAPQGRSSSYTVRARDAAGNVGRASSAVRLTARDTIAPTTPPLLTVSRSRTSATLTWTRASDNVGVTGYLVFRGSTQVRRVSASTVRTSVGSLRAGTRYTFRVVAVDAAGNRSPAATVTG
ncbi:fibronectin type III domain-containing protein [Nocardioides caldifontis]|uniref:fibronectin type III domain-containing protein n=1 Tax=Nocardioides caldifontis TaxID=2588938 RepID=UPI0011DFE535|nr:fibronectin type III domain-containing protein [Nocardioides caldifontis]